MDLDTPNPNVVVVVVVVFHMYVCLGTETGGYYLVTTGLAKKYPGRVSDFPPDETALLGAGIGYAQSGLVPIVEIPYAKYLDCGADMFYEAIVRHWLSGGTTSNGMVIRLQGFDRGVFGGNFHTHNVSKQPCVVAKVAKVTYCRLFVDFLLTFC
jgi:pyruvate/2-oxoglutarate/acetoin dehydrogenase E1 component